jgi:uncharacterized protein YdhG (YjbR/CyaY superfamily)
VPRFTTVDEYMEALPEDARAVLAKVRQTLLKAVPGAEEVISYQIPTIKLDGRVFHYAAWKQHYSLYPVTESLLEAFGTDLAAHEVEKGTIRFPYDRPVPVKLITAMAKFRAQENAQVAASKPSKAKAGAKK